MDRWRCQSISTTRSRRNRTVTDMMDIFEELLAIGDTERLGHYLTCLDAVLAGQPVTPKLDAIYNCDEMDATEDLKEAAYRRNPNKQTAREWFDHLGKEARANEPAMASLRQEWSL